MRKNKDVRIIFALFLIITIATFLRLYKLDSIPGEMWGDVIEHYRLTQKILNGNFYLSYAFGGDGPLFSYISASISKIVGLSFWSLKFSTAIIGILLAIVTFYFSLELFSSKKIALVSSFLTAVSFWSLTFSRQGKPHILVPFIITISLYYLLKKRYFVAGFFLGLGMYSQAGFWGAFLFSLYNPISFLIAFITSLPLILNINNSIALSGNFYVEKLGINSNFSLFHSAQTLLINIWKNILSFNIRGDNCFRHSISGQPHVDFTSGILFIIGFLLIIVSFIKKENKKLWPFFIYPFLIIQIPSIMDINNPTSIPNMGRMIGIIPFVYMSIAYGLVKLINLIKNKIIENFLLAIILIAIFLINFNNYFFKYPSDLPNGNVPFGKIIADEINKYDNKINKIIVTGCCWGEWGQPEPDGIRFQLKNDKKLISYNNDNLKEFIFSEADLDDKEDVLFILNPNDFYIGKEIGKYFKNIKEYSVIKNGLVIGKIIYGKFYKI